MALLVISEIDRLFEALSPAAEQRYRDTEQREETMRLENDRHTDAIKVAALLQCIDERDVALWHSTVVPASSRYFRSWR